MVDLDHFLEGNVYLEIDPYGLAPLSARLTFSTDVAAEVTITVTGQEPISHTFSGFKRDHQLPVLGLYPDTTNKVILHLLDQQGNSSQTTIMIETAPLPDYFPEVELVVNNESLMQSGWTLCGFSRSKAGDFASVPFMIDGNGDIRWYILLENLFSELIYPIRSRANGHLLIADDNDIFEYSLLGERIWSLSTPGYRQHHEITEKPNGNLLIAVDDQSLSTDHDHVIEVDESGNVLQTWDLRQLLDVDRFDLLEKPIRLVSYECNLVR